MSASPFHNSRRFAGKRLHLGVCGSIACYKELDLLRALHALDIHVSVTLTDGARRFVTPLRFEFTDHESLRSLEDMLLS